MTEYTSGGLIRGTLADLVTLMSHPVGMRRGYTALVKPNNPAAGAGLTYKIDSAWWERLVAVTCQLATSATAGERSLLLAYVDQDGFVFNQTLIADQIPASTVLTAYGDLDTTTPVSSATGQSAQGSLTSPGASATIAQLTLLPAGTYLVTAYVNLAGTLVQGTDANNLKIFNGGVLIYEALDNGIAAGLQTFGPFAITVPAGGSIALATVIAGSAGSIYSGLISVQETTLQGSFTFPDIVLKSGWSAQIQISGVQAGDQLSAIGILTNRHPSNWADGALGQDLEAELLELGR